MKQSARYPLQAARAYEKLRYLAHAVDACGGRAGLAMRTLGLQPGILSQYTERCLLTLRRYNRAAPRLPRPRRKYRVMHEAAFERLKPFHQHMSEWEYSLLRRTIAKCGGSKVKAAELLGVKPCTIYTKGLLKFPALVNREHPNAKPRLTSKSREARMTAAEREKLYRWLMVMLNLLATLALLGFTVSPTGSIVQRTAIKTEERE